MILSALQFLLVKYEALSRIRSGIGSVDQAHAVWATAALVLRHFRGFSDADSYLALREHVNRTGLVVLTDPDTDSVGTAIREVVERRLPALLCVALVSAVEACLEDVGRLESGGRQFALRGGPREYLPRLGVLLGYTRFEDKPWLEFQELVATRNVLVHRSRLAADDTYVRNSGILARAAAGEALVADATYLEWQFKSVRGALQSLLTPSASWMDDSLE